MKLHRRSQVVQRRADVQNLATVLFQLCKGGATNIKSALQIDVHDSAKPIGRQLLSRTKEVSGSAVHNDIDFAELFDRLCDRLFDFLRLANVSRNSYRLTAVVVDRLCGRSQVVDLATHECDRGACLGECARNAASNTSSAAGNERHVSFQNSFIEDCFAHDSDLRLSAEIR